jgi:hypothetical protein
VESRQAAAALAGELGRGGRHPDEKYLQLSSLSVYEDSRGAGA